MTGTITINLMDSFETSLLESLQFGFVNERIFSDKTYAPKLLINNPDEKRFVITDIDEELRKCDTFYFSVAFDIVNNG